MIAGDLEMFIEGMKARENEERRLADEHTCRAIAIQTERMKLEARFTKLILVENFLSSDGFSHTKEEFRGMGSRLRTS